MIEVVQVSGKLVSFLNFFIPIIPSPLQLLVKNLQFEDGKMISAAQYFSSGSNAAVELTEEEKSFAEQMRVDPPLIVHFRMISNSGVLTVDGVSAGRVEEHPEQRESDRRLHRFL